AVDNSIRSTMAYDAAPDLFPLFAQSVDPESGKRCMGSLPLSPAHFGISDVRRKRRFERGRCFFGTDVSITSVRHDLRESPGWENDGRTACFLGLHNHQS